MADHDAARLGAVFSRERGRPPGSLPPCVEQAQSAGGRPDGVIGEADRVADRVPLGLVALRDRRLHGAVRSQEALEACASVPGKCGDGIPDPVPDDLRLAGPWDDALKEDVPVCNQHPAFGEIHGVLRAQLGVVVSGEERDGQPAGAEIIQHLEPAVVRPPGVAARPGVQGVAVQHEELCAFQERAQVPGRAHGARALAEMDVGYDSDEAVSHSVFGTRDGRRGIPRRPSSRRCRTSSSPRAGRTGSRACSASRQR